MGPPAGTVTRNVLPSTVDMVGWMSCYLALAGRLLAGAAAEEPWALPFALRFFGDMPMPAFTEGVAKRRSLAIPRTALVHTAKGTPSDNSANPFLPSAAVQGPHTPCHPRPAAAPVAVWRIRDDIRRPRVPSRMPIDGYA